MRSRLEAGIDAIAEVMEDDTPTAKMIAVQVKSTEAATYPSESASGFTYTVRSTDFEYWRGSNLPVILVLYRMSDDSFYWKSLGNLVGSSERTLQFDKQGDKLDRRSKDRLAALTVEKQGHGYYVPPLGGGEEAIVNMLPLRFPQDIYVAQTQMSTRQALARMNKTRRDARYDWMIDGSSLWIFTDPLTSSVRHLIERDQVEKIETSFLADHEAEDQRFKFSGLLRHTLIHQQRDTLGWHRKKGIFFFLPRPGVIGWTFRYLGAKQKTKADVVSVYKKSEDDAPVDYVRHHAFMPRFERLADQWSLIVNPTYHFTSDGSHPLSYPDALLSGKKRLDNNNAVRGQVIMWHRFLANMAYEDSGKLLEAESRADGILEFGSPPVLELPKSVPDDVWGSKRKRAENRSENDAQGALDL